MRKILVLLASLMLAVSLALVPSAANASVYYTPRKCDTTSVYGGLNSIRTCMQLGYHLQTDGSGVVIDHIWFDVTDNCLALADGATDYSDIRAFKPTGGWTDYQSVTFYSCHGDKDISVRGPDVGKAWVSVSARYSVDGAPDVDGNPFNFWACPLGC